MMSIHERIHGSVWRVHMPALRILLIYLLFGVLWIGASDHLALYLTRDIDPAWYPRIQLVKGTLFVAVTAILLYVALITTLREGHCEDSGTRIREDGSRFRTDVVITPLFDHQHHHTSFVEVPRDVIDRKLLRDSLESFDYSLSHELSAPLRAINGFADILLEQHA